MLAFGYAFSWVFATIGLVTRNPEAAQFAAGACDLFRGAGALRRRAQVILVAEDPCQQASTKGEHHTSLPGPRQRTRWQ